MGWAGSWHIALYPLSSPRLFFSCPALICKAKALLCLFPYQVTASIFVPYPGLERRTSEVRGFFWSRPAIKTTNDFPFPPVLPVVLFCRKKSFPKEMLQSHEEGKMSLAIEFEGFSFFSPSKKTVAPMSQSCIELEGEIKVVF